MMNPGASIVPYNEQNSAAADAVESGGETGMLGAMIRRNRTLAVNVSRQEIEVREEVFAMEHSGQRDDLERELQESRRRIDEQGLVRSQQLLNYTHEHVERSRVESERRLEEQIKNGILSLRTIVSKMFESRPKILLFKYKSSFVLTDRGNGNTPNTPVGTAVACSGVGGGMRPS
ncbi:hypothetical protein PI124_g13285 [Phytophthora idaei]|nr:hypothetical protein PI125_g19860 [Phytophthora idaei]KAG3137039.1 hypothetical protein PI126_g17557 [Phytophthora idaei]KAG3241846.1 hypothetical protein PI124_g13285 [Phytophthora idaei]